VLPVTLLDEIVERTLLEDSSSFDVTTLAIVPERARACGVARAKSPQVVCGSFVAERVFQRLDPAVRFETLVGEGVSVEVGQVLWRVTGLTRALLVAERAALNLVQRMGGVATLTRRFVAALPTGSKTRIADTRKTTPGLRAFERYAVRTGGGSNHRDNLSSAVLIKDNHISAAGSVREAIQRARAFASHTMKLEVEVEDLAMLDEALAVGVDIVMLDNFRPADIADAVQRAQGRALVEVSGNVTLERIPELARLGVDVISSGALTHSAAAADISLRLEALAD
jgi:nicotinate-nucleotide pyrophosphorylase (carboxylating)